MSYQIIYGKGMESNNRSHRGKRLVLTVLFFGFFLWSVHHFWPEGRELLKTVLIPGNPDATLEAAQVFAQELGCGFSLADAAGNFFEAVRSHEYPG